MTVIVAAGCMDGSGGVSAQTPKQPAPNAWRPLPSAQEKGLLAERVDLWRKNRLWHMADSGYLLSGFESRPGIHPWQGEHLGKWLHAATLAYEQTHDEKLGQALKDTVDRLLATQDKNGYMGTYADDYTFMALPENIRKSDIADDVTSSIRNHAPGIHRHALRAYPG